MKLEFSLYVLEKKLECEVLSKFPSGSRVLCGRTVGQTDMTKLIVAFDNFANAHKMLKLSASFGTAVQFRSLWLTLITVRIVDAIMKVT
jgi:hypothetical protein